ncbi:MAG: Ig-like domain-containing protein, partial [Gemmataceae bacterium]
MTVTVANAVPVANPDTATAQTATAKTINVLANDTDADGGVLVITGNSTPANGTVTISGGNLV